jgi:hypothetical protein
MISGSGPSRRIIRQGDDHGMGFFVVAEGEVVVTVDGRVGRSVGLFREVALITIACDGH